MKHIEIRHDGAGNRITNIPYRYWPWRMRFIERVYRITHGGQLRTVCVRNDYDRFKGVSLWGRGLMTRIAVQRYCPLGDYSGYWFDTIGRFSLGREGRFCRV